MNHDQKSPAIASGAIQAQSSFGNAAVNATADATAIKIATVRVEVRMLRSIGLALSLVAIMLAACGRQVTFPPPGTVAGLPAGNMLIRYTVAGTFDFTDYTYAIVFNTSGNGGTPYANTQFNGGFLNYSFAWFVGGKFGTVQSPPVLLQYYLTPGSTTNVGTQQIVVPLNLATLTLNSNGQNSQFTLLFSRSLLRSPADRLAYALAGADCNGVALGRNAVAEPDAAAFRRDADAFTGRDQLVQRAVHLYLRHLVRELFCPRPKRGTIGRTRTQRTQRHELLAGAADKHDVRLHQSADRTGRRDAQR